MDMFDGYFGLAVLYRKRDNQVINVYKTENDVIQAYLSMPNQIDLDWKVIDFNFLFQELIDVLPEGENNNG